METPKSKKNVVVLRFIIALIGGPPILAAIYFGDIAFFVFILGIMFISLHEFITMFERKWHRQSFFLPIYVLNSLLVFTAFTWGQNPIWRHPLTIAMVVLVIFFFIYEIKLGKIFLKDNLTFHVIRSIFYLGMPLSYLILTRSLYCGLTYTAYIAIVIWLNDVYAYLIGKNWGRHKLNEAISPKKTVEGLLAGIIAVFIFNIIIAPGYHFSPLIVVILSLFIPILSTLSDLSESLLKRTVGVKDSGAIVPGHGGFLDRFDSFILVAPLYYYLLVYFIHP